MYTAGVPLANAGTTALFTAIVKGPDGGRVLMTANVGDCRCIVGGKDGAIDQVSQKP